MCVVGRLKDQGHGFRDRHEVADDPLVCDGHWAALRDLLLEERDHTSVAAQHVSETHGHEVRVGLAVHHLHDHLTEALGGAHDVRRVHRLVRGDQDELLHARCGRSLRHLIGPFHVILDRLVGAVLHERHMFVGRGVEDDIRMIGLHDALNASCIADGPDEGHQVEPRIRPLQLLLDGVSVVFIDIEDDQRRRIGFGDLAAELAADGSAAPGHQDVLPFQGGQDLIIIYFYLGAAQQIGDLHVPELADADFSVDQLVGRRYGLQLASCVLAYVEDGLLVRPGRGRDRIDDAGNPVLLYFLFDVVPVAHDRHAFQHPSLFIQVVIDHTAHLAVQVAAVCQLPDERKPCLAAADDHDPVHIPFRIRLGFMYIGPEQPVGEPERRREQQAEHISYEVIGPGHAEIHRQDPRQIEERQEDVSLDDALGLIDAGEPPDAVIQAEAVEDDCRHRRPVGHGPHITGQVFRRYAGKYKIKPEQQRRQVGDQYGYNVQEQQHACPLQPYEVSFLLCLVHKLFRPFILLISLRGRTGPSASFSG